MGFLASWRQYSNVAQKLQPRGCYSVQRLRRLRTYMENSSYWRLLSVCLLTPLPCVALATFIESVPLAPPEAGPYNNHIFWIRAWIVTSFVDYSMVLQMSQSLSRLKMKHSYIILIALVGSIISFAAVFGVAVWIAFPVPFSMLVASPPSVVVILLGIGYSWSDQWRSDAGLRRDLARHLSVFLCQVALTFIYPLYIFGFSSLSGVGQLCYVLLLPVIKSISKNWISYTLTDQDDIKPEVVIFNVEVFNALYVSSAVQNSSSVGTTIAIMLLDVLHFWFSMRGTLGMLNKVKDLMEKIPSSHPAASENFVEVALRLLAIQDHAESSDRLRSQHNMKRSECIAIKEKKSSVQAPTNADILKVVHAPRGRRILMRIMPKKTKVVPVATHLRVPGDKSKCGELFEGLKEIFSRQDRADFISTTTRVLYITEYLVLVEYTEAVLPMVYGLYSIVAFHLPNCVYIQSLAELSRRELFNNVGIVFIYGILELTSLVLAMLVLKRTCGISSLDQLGFVLESQATMVQSKLMLWFVYVMQVPLEHVGTDFTFKFTWANASH